MVPARLRLYSIQQGQRQQQRHIEMSKNVIAPAIDPIISPTDSNNSSSDAQQYWSMKSASPQQKT